MPSVVRCFGQLDRRATLAYELYWTCDCLEAPRSSAADSRRQCPLQLCGHNACATDECLHAATCANGKLHLLSVAFVVSTLWVWHYGYGALAASPRGTIHIGWHRQGHLACALGLGWS